MPTVFVEVWQFIQLVFTTWEGYVAGGIIALFAALYERQKGRSIPWPAFKWGAIAFLLISFFIVWRGEYRLRLGLAQEIESRKPDLRLEITSVGVAPAGQRNADAMVTVGGRITNLGSPGTVPNFWIDLELEDSRVLHGRFPLAPEPDQKFIQGVTSMGKDFFLSGSTHWMNTVSSNPLGRNESKGGWLVAVFGGITQEEVLNNGTVVLICSDATGKKYFARHKFDPATADDFAPFAIDEIQKHQRR